MLEELKTQLLNISENNKKMNQCIQDLFLQLKEIHVNWIDKPKSNIFYRVRPEVINQIFGFLDFITVQKFRLVNRRTNQIVLHLLPILSQNEQCQIQNIENSISEYLRKNPISPKDEERIKQTLDQSVNEVKQIKWKDLAFIKTLRNPPIIVEKIINFLTILIDSDYQEGVKTWAQVQKCIQNTQLYQQLSNIDYESISDHQLHLLQPIKDIVEQQVRDASFEAHQIYQFINTIIRSNECSQQLIYLQLQRKRMKFVRRHQMIEKLITKYS